MNIPAATILAFLGTNLGATALEYGAVSAAGKANPQAPESQLAKVGAVAAIGTSAGALGIGYALGGLHKPNTVGRGMLWAGGIGMLFAAFGAVGLAAERVSR